MDQKYDVIVIGAGNAGLVSALELVLENKKVLVLESGNVPGGLSSSFIRGRFEFDTSFYSLCDYGTKEHPGSLYKLFEKLGIAEKINLISVPNAYHVYSADSKEDYKMPFGVMEFIEKMEEYVPGSYNSLKNFFTLAIEVKDALAYIGENTAHIDEAVLANEYENFMKVSSFSVEKVLDALKMPKKAQEILTSYWLYFGSPTETLSFIHFADFLYSYISKGGQIFSQKSFEISLLLAEEIEKRGGEVKYLSTVKEILFKDRKIAGVQLLDGRIYCADHIISSVSPTFVYGKMIPSPMVPKEALKLTNSRVLGGRGFSVFLGLNQSAEDLGLTDYQYFIYHSLNTNKEFQNMSSIKNDSSMAIVMNNANPACSPKGTTIIQFTSLFFGDVFSKNVTEKNYYELKETIAESILKNFETTTGISIKPYIEEIAIATPLTYARYGGYPDGVVCGYKATGMDNLLPRLLSMHHENFIPNLRFCGSFSSLLSGNSSTYFSGELAFLNTLKDMRGDESDAAY